MKNYRSILETIVGKQKEEKPEGNVKGGVNLIFGDTHSPFLHKDTVEFLRSAKKKFEPDCVTCTGDELDFHAVSRWPSDPDGLSAAQELAYGVENLTEIYKLFPNVRVCTSNHTARPFKRAFESGLPSSILPAYKTLTNAPEGWRWADFHLIDGVRIIHGEGRSGKSAHTNFMNAYKQSVVIGHIHSYAGVNYEGPYFAMNVGCLIDSDAYAFKYAKVFPVPVNLGCGLVIDGKEAHFIPMLTDKHNRWTGRLSL